MPSSSARRHRTPPHHILWLRPSAALGYMGAFDEIVAVRFEQTNRERTAHRVEGYRAHGGPWVGSVCERVRSTGAVFAHHTSRAPNSNNRVLSAS